MIPIPNDGRIWIRATAIAAVAFGALTLREGGAVLFGGPAARAAVGHYVPFVVWFNFFAGFAYIVGGFALWRRRPWAVPLALAIAAATLAVFAAFAIYVASGGAYEMRTVYAMTLRSAVWLGIWALARRFLRSR